MRLDGQELQLLAHQRAIGRVVVDHQHIQWDRGAVDGRLSCLLP
jgi:hypothetical protein